MKNHQYCFHATHEISTVGFGKHYRRFPYFQVGPAIFVGNPITTISLMFIYN